MAAAKNGYRLVAFDVDGTLVKSPSGKVVWELLNYHLCGDDTVNVDRFEAYRRGDISYERWVELDVRDWMGAGATRDHPGLRGARLTRSHARRPA